MISIKSERHHCPGTRNFLFRLPSASETRAYLSSLMFTSHLFPVVRESGIQKKLHLIVPFVLSTVLACGLGHSSLPIAVRVSKNSRA